MNTERETVQDLLNVLSLLGFTDTDGISGDLRKACQDEDSKQFLQTLANNLNAEHVPSLQYQASGTPYQPTPAEKQVAESFASRHKPRPDRSKETYGEAVSSSRQNTATVLGSASKQLEKELTKEIDATENRMQRLDQELQDAAKQADSEMLLVQESLHLLEEALQGLDLVSSSNESSPLLCIQNIHQFKQLDEEWLSELRQYWEAQIADCPTSAAGLVNGWASAALPGTALRLLTEEEEDAAAAKALEVDRIRQSYSTVLEGFIRMNALQAKQEATLQALKGGLVRRELSSQDAAFLMREKKSQQKQLDGLLQTKQQLLSEHVPRLSHDIGSLQCMDVMKAELEIELHRNIFYCTKKKAVADLIQGRAARIVALVVEARHEATALQGMLDSCKTLEEMNQAVSSAIQIRLAKHGATETLLRTEPTPAPSTPRVHLQPHTAIKRLERAPSLHSIKDKQAAVDTLLITLTESTVPQVLASSGEVHSYAFSTSIYNVPSLSNTEALSARKELEQSQDDLQHATEKVFQQQEAYNSILRTNPEKINAERDVFYKFFAKPQVLQKDMKALQTTLQKSKGVQQASPRKTTPRVKRAGQVNPLSKSMS